MLKPIQSIQKMKKLLMMEVMLHLCKKNSNPYPLIIHELSNPFQSLINSSDNTDNFWNIIGIMENIQCEEREME